MLDGAKWHASLATKADHVLGGDWVLVNEVFLKWKLILFEPAFEHDAVWARRSTVDGYSFHRVLLLPTMLRPIFSSDVSPPRSTTFVKPACSSKALAWEERLPL